MAASEILAEIQQVPTYNGPNAGLAKPRMSQYRELVVQVTDQRTSVQSGQLWIATNPTPGTGIASHAAPTATDGTKLLFSINNAYALGTDKHIYMRSLSLAVTVAGAAATESRYEWFKSAAGTSRFSSGGSTNLSSSAIVVNNPGTAPAATSAVVRFGAVVSVADAAAKLIDNGLIRNIIPKVGDKVLFRFGSAPSLSGSSLEVTTAAIMNVDVPFVDLAPGETLVLSLVNASQSGASSYEFKAVFDER